MKTKRISKSSTLALLMIGFICQPLLAREKNFDERIGKWGADLAQIITMPADEQIEPLDMLYTDAVAYSEAVLSEKSMTQARYNKLLYNICYRLADDSDALVFYGLHMDSLETANGHDLASSAVTRDILFDLQENRLDIGTKKALLALDNFGQTDEQKARYKFLLGRFAKAKGNAEAMVSYGSDLNENHADSPYALEGLKLELEGTALLGNLNKAWKLADHIEKTYSDTIFAPYAISIKGLMAQVEGDLITAKVELSRALNDYPFNPYASCIEARLKKIEELLDTQVLEELMSAGG